MTTTSCGIIKDENGLILPRKIANPCVESPFKRDLHREIKWNSNKGINVLNNKTELEKAFAKHKKNLDEKRKEQESTDAFTDEFKKMIAERAKRLEKFEEKQEEETKELKQSSKNKTISHHCQQQQQPPSPAKSKNNLPTSKNISPPSKSPLRRPVPAPTVINSSSELESEFSRVFNQLRGDKHELVV